MQAAFTVSGVGEVTQLLLEFMNRSGIGGKTGR